MIFDLWRPGQKQSVLAETQRYRLCGQGSTLGKKRGRNISRSCSIIEWSWKIVVFCEWSSVLPHQLVLFSLVCTITLTLTVEKLWKNTNWEVGSFLSMPLAKMLKNPLKMLYLIAPFPENFPGGGRRPPDPPNYKHLGKEIKLKMGGWRRKSS